MKINKYQVIMQKIMSSNWKCWIIIFKQNKYVLKIERMKFIRMAHTQNCIHNPYHPVLENSTKKAECKKSNSQND